MKTKLEFGRLWETVEETRDHIERRDRPEVAEAGRLHGPQGHVSMCFNAVRNNVDPAKTILGVIEIFKAIDASSDVLAGLKARN